MKGFRELAMKKNASLLAELYGLLDELARPEKFSARLILSALTDHNPEVRSYAARKLGLSGLGRQDIVQGLANALNDDYTSVRQYASAALGVLEPLPVSAIDAITRATEDVDPTVREFSKSNLVLIQRKLASEAIAS